MPVRKSKVFVVLVTAPTQQEAKRLSTLLIKNRLAACVNILYPIESVFRWKGKTETAKEALLIVKTLSPKFSAIQNLIQKHHSYDVPEIIGWKIDKANQPYLDWIGKSVR